MPVSLNALGLAAFAVGAALLSGGFGYASLPLVGIGAGLATIAICLRSWRLDTPR